MRSANTAAIRAILVDDEGLARDSFSTALAQDPGIDLLATTNETSEAVILVNKYQPDVILTEIRLGYEKPLETIAAIPDLRAEMVVITSREAECHLFRALTLGARGYLLKSTTRAELSGAIRAVARGNAYLCPPMARILLDRFTILPPEGGHGENAFPELSDREVEVLRGIALGMSNTEIAQDLSLTIATVKSHVSNVLTKLGLRDRLQAGILAHRKGLTRT